MNEKNSAYRTSIEIPIHKFYKKIYKRGCKVLFSDKDCLKNCQEK